MSMDRYTALALQTRCYAVNKMDRSAARKAMKSAIARIDEQIRGSLVLTGPTLKLVVLPEYFMTGYTHAGALTVRRNADVAHVGRHAESRCVGIQPA